MSILQDRLKAVQIKENVIDRQIEQDSIRPTLSEKQLADQVIENISEKFKVKLTAGFTDELKQEIISSVKDTTEQMNLDYETKKRIEKIAISNIIGLGPIETFINDPTITEIIVQRYDKICVEKNGAVYRSKASFTDENHLRNIINRIVQPVGRQINLQTPIVDARLADGSRVHAVIPPVAPDGAMLTIRKFSEQVMTGEDYIKLGSIHETMLEFLANCVKGKENIIVSGGTGAGKTTFLNLLSTYIPSSELIITIEDDCELQLKQPNVRRLEAKGNISDTTMPITIRTLVKACLRMRPDRIIVGEIRDGAVVDMITAMGTGHDGSMSTAHANSPINLVNARLPILYSMDDSTFSAGSQMLQISEALQIIVQISRMPDHSRKVTHITVVDGIENGRIRLLDIFRYNPEKGFYTTGVVPKKTINRLKQRGIELPTDMFKERVL